jgi:hypothetical protein
MTPETYAIAAVLVAWAIHAKYLKVQHKRDMLGLIALQLKATGRTPWRA